MWAEKNEAEKRSIVEKFLSVTVKKKEKTAVSTDGELHIPTTPSVARKPGQRKRVHTRRTTTLKYKKTKLK